MSWADWIGLGISGYEALKDSQNAMSAQDLFATQRPDVSTPIYNVENQWNSGKPSSTMTYSPQMQPIADAFMSRLGSAPQTRQMSEGQRQVQNAQQNWQLARYGMQPNELAPRDNYFGGGSNIPPYGGNTGGGGSEIGDSTTGGLGGGRPSDTIAGTGKPLAGGGKTYEENRDPRFDMNPITGGQNGGIRDFFGDDLDWYTGDGRYSEDWSGIPYDEKHGGFGGSGETWWEGVKGNFADIPTEELSMVAKALLSLSSPVAAAGFIANNWDELSGYFGGGEEGVMNPNSPDFADPNDPDTVWDGEEKGDGGDGWNFNYRRPSIGEYGNSIDRGYGYATRLRPRGGGGVYDDPRTVQIPDPDKIGG